MKVTLTTIGRHGTLIYVCALCGLDLEEQEDETLFHPTEEETGFFKWKKTKKLTCHQAGMRAKPWITLERL